MKFKSAKHDSQEVIQEIKNYKENGSAPHIYEDFEEIRGVFVGNKSSKFHDC